MNYMKLDKLLPRALRIRGVTNHFEIREIVPCFTEDDGEEDEEDDAGARDKSDRAPEPGEGSLRHGSDTAPGSTVAWAIPCCSGRLEEMAEQTVPETLLTQL
ncbi:uncharacterized protein V6R79_003071 [Siganus canaliculatus]